MYVCDPCACAAVCASAQGGNAADPHSSTSAQPAVAAHSGATAPRAAERTGSLAVSGVAKGAGQHRIMALRLAAPTNSRLRTPARGGSVRCAMTSAIERGPFRHERGPSASPARTCVAWTGRHAHQAGAGLSGVHAWVSSALLGHAFPPCLAVSPAEPRPRAAGHHRGLQNLQGADRDRALLAQSELHRCVAAQARCKLSSALTRATLPWACPVGANGAGKTNFFHGACHNPVLRARVSPHSSAGRRRRQPDT